MEEDANYRGTVCSRTAQFVPQRSIRRIFQEKRLSFIPHIRLQGFEPQAELVFSLSPSQDVLIYLIVYIANASIVIVKLKRVLVTGVTSMNSESLDTREWEHWKLPRLQSL